MSDDPRLSAPSAARNRAPILKVLRLRLPISGTVLKISGTVLKIASGMGERVTHFTLATTPQSNDRAD